MTMRQMIGLTSAVFAVGLGYAEKPDPSRILVRSGSLPVARFAPKGPVATGPETAETAWPSFPRPFAAIFPRPDRLQGRGAAEQVAAGTLLTPSGKIPLANLHAQPRPFALAVEAADGIDTATDVWMACRAADVHPGAAATAMMALERRLRLADAVPLSRPGPECLVIGGGAANLPGSLSVEGLRVYAWAPGLFADPDIAIAPMPTPEQASDPVLHLVASVFRGADVDATARRLEALGATLEGRSGGMIALAWPVAELRAALDALTGLSLRALSERSTFVSADEEVSTSLQTGEFNGGRRPYVEAGVDGSSQVIAVSDTGLSLDATVFADGVPGAPGSATPGTPGLAHRKIVGYVRAADLPGNALGGGDLLTCDGTSGLTHGHLVASIAAANAAELVDDIRLLPGFETARVGTATQHAVDGVAPGARVLFIDTQAAGACTGNSELESQEPGLLSANASAARGFGLAHGLDLRIHNLSFSRYAPLTSPAGAYTIDAQDLDAFLHDNQDYLVVVAAGNRGMDAGGDGNLDFGSITSPGTAKNVLTVGASVYPNDTLDPDDAHLRGIPNRGIEMIARFGELSSSQGPAAFTTDGLANDWRIKPDVVAPGDETIVSERLVGPVTCISTDDDQAGPVECARHAAGGLYGSSFSAAGVSGAAALVRDYFRKGYAPAGQAGGAPQDLSGPELKAAIVASADLLTGNFAWRFLGGQHHLTFYNPRHLTRPTPEQGYGRVQLDHLLPLASDPGTPSFILSERAPLALAPAPGSVHERLVRIVRADEEFRVVTAWYDLESDQAGKQAEGGLVRDLDLTLTDCGADDECDTMDDLTYFGNHFHEDENFDRNLVAIPDEFTCGGIPGGWECEVNSPDCDGHPDGTSCLRGTDNPSEDCDGDGLLGRSEFSLAIDPARVASLCDSGARDRNNGVEAIFLSPDQLAEGRLLRLRLEWVRTSEVTPPTEVGAGLVIVGGFIADLPTDRIRLDKPEYACADALALEVLDGAGDDIPEDVGTDVVVVSRDAGGGLVDQESAWEFQPVGGDDPPAGTSGGRFVSAPRAVSSRFAPVRGDGILSVVDEGRIEASYEGGAPGTGVARATARVRCRPMMTLLPTTRRGTNAKYGLSGGCDPRARVDPRGILFGQRPGEGLNTSGDRYLDAGESLIYSVSLRNDEPGLILTGAAATLRACAAGTGSTGPGCIPAPEVMVLGGAVPVGTVAPGRTQTVSFNLRVSPAAAFPRQIDLVFEVVPLADAMAVAHRSVFRHVLDVDSFDDPALGPEVDGVYRYSSDFPRGGREIRVLAAEAFDPTDPDMAAETFVFQDATVSGPGLIGNATLLGFDPSTGRFERTVPNNWPWTFDLDDEGWASRRRFDSDPGANAELAARNVWQWNNTGECGFQSNDPSQPDGAWFDPNNVIRGRGGIWHTGHALSQPGTPGGRAGYDLGCEDFDIPGDVFDPRREAVLDVVSSPVFHRVHAGPDPLGFAYTLEFTRLAFNTQFSARDGNAIFGWELDPDARVPEPVDALDFGWLSSDQGPGGFLAVSPGPSDSDMPHAVFNPNDPHEVSSARALGMLLEPGGANQNITALHGPGSPGPFHEVGDSNKAPARSYGELKAFTGRGFGSPGRRGAAGLPLRNREELLDGLEGGGITFEDLFGPNETRPADPGVPVTPADPERLLARRDAFQVNFTALLRESANPSVLALSSYGFAFDDVVVEWVEAHPVADRTPCADPSTWTPSGEGTPSARPDLAGGCAGIAWDRATITEPDVALVLTIIDADAQFGPDGVDQEASDPANDDQADDLDGDGFAELEALVVSDTDPLGEVVRLEQQGFVSSVYQAVVQVSGTDGLTSTGDGIIFAQENGDRTNPVAVTAAYVDQDINVSGVNGAAVPCPDNPRTAMALTDFDAADILFVTARVTDEGPGADGDNLADDGETIRLDVAMFNRALEPPGRATEIAARFGGRLDVVRPRRGPLENVEVKLLSTDPDVACILDDTVRFASLSDNQLAWSSPSDPLRFVVGRPSRSSTAALVQAEFILAIRGEYTDADGQRRRIAAFATPQRFALNLDLDIGGEPPAAPLAGDSACVGGSGAGRACVSNADCPGEVAPGQAAACMPLPGYFRAGGTSPIAGEVGYFEGFEGAAAGAGAGRLGSTTVMGPIPGTGFSQFPGINAISGFLSYSPYRSPNALPTSVGADTVQGTSTVDGTRCQYNDPRGPQKHPRSEAGARPWTGSDWHVTAEKAFSGLRSLRAGTDGTAIGKDASFDSYHTNQLSAAFSAPVTIGTGGGAILSMQHIVQVADDRTFSIPDGSTADRAYVQVADAEPAGSFTARWHTIHPFQNAYDKRGTPPHFANVIFDPYDDFYDAEAALGGTPGFDPDKLTPTGVPLNRDDVSTEDDFFDPNDPQRLFGPSSGCFPESAFAALGDYTATDPQFVPGIRGARGAVGPGIWVNSLFVLDEFAGRNVRIRFLFTGIDISVNARWDQLFGNSLGNATRGWVIDDVAASGLLDRPVTLAPDTRTPGEGACPVDPDPATPANEAACGSVTAEAGSDLVAPISATGFTLDGSASTSDTCVDGALVYRWRVGGAILSDFRAEPELSVRPADTTVYTLDVRCSTDPACGDSDSVAVLVEDAGEVSGLPGTLGLVGFRSRGLVVTEWEARADDVDIHVLGVDVQRGGRALRDPPPGEAAALGRRLCHLGVAFPGQEPGRVEFDDYHVSVSAGELFGYLAVASFPGPAGLVHGSLGQGESPGRPAALPRGRVDPTTLAECGAAP